MITFWLNTDNLNEFSPWCLLNVSGSAGQKEHHEPGVAAERGHVHGAPAVPGGEPGVGPVLDQQLAHLGPGLDTPGVLGHHLQRGQALGVVLVDVDALDVFLQELLQLRPLAQHHKIKEVSLELWITFSRILEDGFDWKGGHRADGSQHGLIDCAHIFWPLGYFFTVLGWISLQTSFKGCLDSKTLGWIYHDHDNVFSVWLSAQNWVAAHGTGWRQERPDTVLPARPALSRLNCRVPAVGIFWDGTIYNLAERGRGPTRKRMCKVIWAGMLTNVWWFDAGIKTWEDSHIILICFYKGGRLGLRRGWSSWSG